MPGKRFEAASVKAQRVFYSLMSLALCVASASLPLFIIWIFYNLSVHLIIFGEEKYCLKTYWIVYGHYMKRFGDI